MNLYRTKIFFTLALAFLITGTANAASVSVIVDGETYACFKDGSGTGGAIRINPGTYAPQGGGENYTISNVSYSGDKVSGFNFSGYPVTCEYVTCRTTFGWEITILNANSFIFNGRDFNRKTN